MYQDTNKTKHFFVLIVSLLDVVGVYLAKKFFTHFWKTRRFSKWKPVDILLLESAFMNSLGLSQFERWHVKCYQSLRNYTFNPDL